MPHLGHLKVSNNGPDNDLSQGHVAPTNEDGSPFAQRVPLLLIHPFSISSLQFGHFIRITTLKNNEHLATSRHIGELVADGYLLVAFKDDFTASRAAALFFHSLIFTHLPGSSVL